MTTTGTTDTGFNKDYSSENSGAGINAHDHAPINGAGAGINHPNAPRGYDYGGNPLAHLNTGDSARFPAFGGEFQPGLYRPTSERKFANPAPLGLSAFALTTFVLSLINIGTAGVHEPNIIVALAFGYGGLIQLLAGMWEMAIGNTFGATALSSYGGFWISVGIIFTPGGFDIVKAYSVAGSSVNDFNSAYGFFLMGWFIFTTILLLCTLRSTLAFFLLFLTLDMTYLMLGTGSLHADAAGVPNPALIKAGGYFGIFSAFIAWYNAFAGLADDSNSFFLIPVAHFPWSVKGRERRNKNERETV